MLGGYDEDDDATFKDSILIAQDGKITFDTQEPVFIYLDHYDSYSRAKLVEALVLPSSRIKINGKELDDRILFTATGSDFMVDFSKKRNQELKYALAYDSINKLINIDPTKEEYFNERDRVLKERAKSRTEYIVNNPNTDLAVYYTADQREVELFFEMYDQLGENIKNGVLKDYLNTEYQFQQDRREYFKQKEANVISAGNPAPDFTLKSVDGSDFSLTDLKGKWVVLDFWGTWCGWCLKGIPDMKTAYDRHKDKMEIVSIACSDKEDKVKIAIEKHKMNWTQLMSDGIVNISYAVGSYPTKIIIDPNGVIAYNGSGTNVESYTE